MAKKVTVTLMDDLDPDRQATESVAFGLDGVNYEIDLSDTNAMKLRGALGPYVTAARRIGGRRGKAGTARYRSASNRSDTHAIRKWAQDNGYDIAERGRIPVEIEDAYQNAQGGTVVHEPTPKRTRAKKDTPADNEAKELATA